MEQQKIFKSEQARIRMEDWFNRFLDKIDVPLSQKAIDTSLGPNHVLIAGDPSKPKLICLHSMLTSSAHLISELGELASHFQLIAPDLPGQSAKGIPVRLPYDTDRFAEWLAELLDGLSLERANLFGVSFGGFVARQFCLAQPARVQRLVLMVPAGIVKPPMLKGMSRMAIPMMMYKLRSSDFWLRRLTAPLLTTWDSDWAHYLGNTFTDFVADLRIPPIASDEQLKALSMPTLVIAAENDISFPGKKLIDRVMSQIPQIETELIKDGKHCPPTTEAFRKWLSQRVVQFFENDVTNS